jgi:hypothetical protein
VQCGYLGVKREAIVEAAEHGNVELMELLIANGALSERWSFANFLPGRPLLAACWVHMPPVRGTTVARLTNRLLQRRRLARQRPWSVSCAMR